MHTQGHLYRLSQLAFENKTLLLHYIIHIYIISIFNYQRYVIKERFHQETCLTNLMQWASCSIEAELFYWSAELFYWSADCLSLLHRFYWPKNRKFTSLLSALASDWLILGCWVPITAQHQSVHFRVLLSGIGCWVYWYILDVANNFFKRYSLGECIL